MARSPAKAPPKSTRGRADRGDWSRTVALVLIAVVLTLGASAWMAWLIVPLVFALVLAVALRPLADRLERAGLPRVGASIVCTLLVALGLLGVGVLVTAQAGQVVRNSERYIERLSGMAAASSGPVRDNELVQAVLNAAGDEDEPGGSPAEDESRDEGDRPGRDESAGGDRDDVAIPVMPPDPPPSPADDDTDGPRAGESRRGEGDERDEPASDEGRPEAGAEAEDIGSKDYWQERISRNADTIGGWVAQGVGGAIGLIGQAVVLIFLVLYVLNSRSTWSERIENASHALGLTLGRDHMDTMGRSIARWTWIILGLAVGYAAVIALAGALLGLPHWPLWGVLTGLLVLVPFFGPLIAAAMLAIVAAIAGQGWGPPMGIVAIFLILQGVEWFVIHPRLYGRTVHFDSLTVLLGVLLFGFLWGPLGFIAALPVLVLLRGFVEVTPGSEAVAALLGEGD